MSLHPTRAEARGLLDGGWIQQDSRDSVPWNDPEATFYTVRARGPKINEWLGRRERAPP